MHEKGLLLAACPYLILRAQSLHILTGIIRSVLWRADTKWCVSESFRNPICWQDGLQPDVCSINTAIASCKDSGRTSVNSREIEKEFVRCTALLNLINYTWHCIPWLDYCERCRPGIWMKALLLFHQMPAQCLYTDANGLGATLASCQGSGVCASLSWLPKYAKNSRFFSLV